MSNINIKNNYIDRFTLNALQKYVRSDSVPWVETSDSWTGRFVHLHLIDNPVMQDIIFNIAEDVAELITEQTGNKVAVETCQLVRWRPGDQLDPPHADAENLDGSPHPYPQRHYSALIYLNNDFEGGQIFFPKHNLTPEIIPGMLVQFTGKAEDLHGVTRVTAGIRYTIVMFFTRIE